MRQSAYLLLSLTLLTVFAGLGWAQTEGSTIPVAALDRGLTNLSAGKPQKSFASRYDELGPTIDQAFDLPAIMQAVIGPRWRSLPADQQQRLFAVFRSYTIANYVANFSGDNGTEIKMLQGAQSVGNGQMIPTQISSAGGEPTKISYLVKAGSKGWQINDVYLDGTISQVAVQRSDFRSLLASSNGAKPLIAQLEKKVSDLSGGAVKP